MDNLAGKDNDYIWNRPTSKKFPIFITKEEDVNIRQGYAEDLLDISLSKTVIFRPFQVTKINLGIKVFFPSGYRGQLRVRSSIAQKGIIQIAGVIDSHYLATIQGLFVNIMHNEITLQKGEFITQLDIMRNIIFTPLELPKNIRLQTERYTKGFGSTNTLSNSIHDSASESMHVDFKVCGSNMDFKEKYITTCNDCIEKNNYDKSRPNVKKCNITNNSNEIDKLNQINNFCLLMSNSIATHITQYKVDSDRNDYRKNDHLFDNSQFTKKTVQKLRLLQNLISNKGVITQEFFKDLQNADYALRKIRENMSHKDNLNNYTIINGILHKRVRNNITNDKMYIICVPMELLKVIVTKVHYNFLAHPSKNQTLKVIKSLVYHPNIRNTTWEICKNCVQCILGSRQILRTYTGSERTHDSNMPLETIYVDHIPNLPRSTEGKTAILVVVDFASNYSLYYPTTDLTGKHTVEALTTYAEHFGPPKYIVSDNSKSFINEEISKFCTIFSSTWEYNKPYNQQQNIAEKSVDYLKQQLNRVIQNPQLNIRRKWVQYIPMLTIGINRLLYQNLFTRKQLLFGIKHYDSLNILPFHLTESEIDQINPITIKKEHTTERRKEIKNRARLANIASKYFVNQIVIYNHPVTPTINGSKKLLPKNKLFHKIIELHNNGATLKNLETGTEFSTHFKFIQIPEIDETLDIYNIDMYKALSDVTTAEQKIKFKEEMGKRLQESESEYEVDDNDSDFAENIETENYNVTGKQSSYDLRSKTNLLIHMNVDKRIRGIQVSHVTEKYKEQKKTTKVTINMQQKTRIFLEDSEMSKKNYFDILEKLNVDCRDKSSLNQKLLFATIQIKDMSCREVKMLQ